MMLVRRLARPLLASMFLVGGLDSLRNPTSKVPIADSVAPRVARLLPGLADADTETLVRVNAAVQVGAGTLLALNRCPRASAAALAASLVPTTAAGHPFWRTDDPGQRRQQKMQFFKNMSMLGGLLLAAVDTEGRPGLAWRAKHRAEHAEAAVRRGRRSARAAGAAARREARMAAKAARVKLAA